jgi:hypothetical protein
VPRAAPADCLFSLRVALSLIGSYLVVRPLLASASFTAPLDATRAFDQASQRLLDEVAALQIELQKEIARDAGFAAVSQRAAAPRAAPSAPVRGARGGRGRGGGAGRGRSGRGGAIIPAVDVAAAAADPSDDDPEVALRHQQLEQREQAAQEAAERDEIRRRCQADHQAVFADDSKAPLAQARMNRAASHEQRE